MGNGIRVSRELRNLNDLGQNQPDFMVDKMGNAWNLEMLENAGQCMKMWGVVIV